ncbi:hypothetical protein WEU38_16545 [Cyanobacterium aponinum AL20118]|uniref:Lipocalin-like domain-containing protein n=1 Tax=Cyanobacterium aponinum AL20115 TaxID=3090662 RepID=A0AAF0ZDS1_9CHRO|nr:hypothetical protein [Cyanobacterium aponinum]MBD2393934.1 hypothetical protein [Cyanobacterium aponinum FACHB-4101]WPF88400.1 hypothetical protein SAY89_16625 [Cyanobacterium aponinum AL20115]
MVRKIPSLLLFSATCFVSFGIFSTNVEAETPSCAIASAQELEGVWESDVTQVLNKQGLLEVSGVLEIKAKTDNILEGQYTWKTKEETKTGNNSEGVKVIEDTETLYGVFNPRNCTLKMVETKESGIHEITILNQNTVEQIFMQSGEYPVVYIRTLERK